MRQATLVNQVKNNNGVAALSFGMVVVFVLCSITTTNAFLAPQTRALSSLSFHHHVPKFGIKTSTRNNVVLWSSTQSEKETTTRRKPLVAPEDANKTEGSSSWPFFASQATATKEDDFAGMGDLTPSLQEDANPDLDEKPLLTIGLGVVAAILSGVALATNTSPTEAVQYAQHFFANPTASLQEFVDNIHSMGPMGAFYFWCVYLLLDIVAIPAVPLTASAGYLFGPLLGTALVLTAASIAAAFSFVVGRTLLRSWVEEQMKNYPKLQKIDRLVGEGGFKLMVLLRLSPFLPFALSNYFYGATKIRFVPYFFGTMLGFTPGTFAYVYGGDVSKYLTIGGGASQPWYIYAGGLVAILGFLKIATDLATGALAELDDESSS